MAVDNHVTLTGNTTREPELRFTPNGQAVASFGLAVNRRYQSNGEWQEVTSFFDVTAWGTLGENIAESLPKGSRVTVAGRLDQRTWQTETGDKRSKVEVVADDVAASMRWASVQITRNPRVEGGQSQPAGGSSPRPARSGGAAPADRGHDPFSADDHEPF